MLTAEGAKHVVTMTDKRIVGVGLADENLLWQLPFPTTGMECNAVTPITDGRTVIYTG